MGLGALMLCPGATCAQVSAAPGQAAAPAERMPLFVRAGSIVPVGEAQEWTRAREGAPITLFVYRGANGRFDLYDDDGVSNHYAQGRFARIPLSSDDRTGTLTIGARLGDYPGMATSQRFVVRVFGPEAAGDPLAPAGAGDHTVTYTGQAMTLRL